jgi:transmembrane sensor
MSRETEAARWYSRMRGADSESHRAAFDRWVRDPANAAAYAEAAGDFEIFDASSPARIAASVRSERAAPGRLRWAGATMAVAVLALGFGWHLYAGKQETRVAVPASQARDAVTLADGSRVTLMDGARVIPAFDDRRRLVRLVGGRARFEVAHDSARPFTVIAGGSETTALGTVFEIDLRHGAPRVALIRGSVAVRASAGGDALRLAPGESAEVPATGARRLPATAAPSPTLIEADGLPLGAVLERGQRGQCDADPSRRSRACLAPSHRAVRTSRTAPRSHASSPPRSIWWSRRDPTGFISTPAEKFRGDSSYADIPRPRRPIRPQGRDE